MGQGLLSAIAFVPRGHCTSCGGITLLSCQCNAVLPGALVLYLVHCFVVMKLLTPLRALVGAGLKPVAPLLGENVGFSGVPGLQWCRRFHVDNVSVSHGPSSFRCCEVAVPSAKKFALRRCVIAKARKSSPCALKTPQIRRFCACWASFFAERLLEGPCWANFISLAGAPVR